MNDQNKLTPLKEAVATVVRQTEMRLIKSTLNAVQWNRRKAAVLLQISYRTLLYKIERYGLNIPRPKYTRKPKIDVTKMLPLPAERAMLLDDFNRGNFDDIQLLADDYGLSIEALHVVIKAEQEKRNE